MQFLRRSALIFISGLFSLFLFTAAIDTGVIATVGRPEPVKKVLADSGIYNSLISNLLKEAQKDNQRSEVPLNNPAIVSAAQKALPPNYVQQQTETIIDSVYRWLDGKTITPDFKINLNEARQRFATYAGQAAEKRAKQLPVCTKLPSSTSVDAFSATCLPYGVTPAQVKARVRSEILRGDSFIENPVINAKTVKAADSNQSVFSDQLKDLPEQYQGLKKTPYLLIILSVLSGLGVIFLSASRRRGVRRVGIILVIAGAFLLLFAWGTNKAIAERSAEIKLDNPVLQIKAKTLLIDITKELNKNMQVFGAGYIVLGAVSVACAHCYKRDSTQPVANTNPSKNKARK